jgi:hypothetical protein
MNEQRRQFFRIQDEGIIQVAQIDQHSLDHIKKDILEQNFDQSDAFKRFFKFESDLQAILLNNKTLSSDWVNIVDLLNTKINQLAKLLAPSHETIFNQASQPISLSANGLGFEHATELPEGELIKIELVLLPQYTYLSFLGRVVYCAKNQQDALGKYTVGLQLEVIRPQDTDRLIQHIMKKEAEFLKYRREQALNPNVPSLGK